ncbi:hypothetical protein KKG31_01465 [Patescibacteria group bacterium]|nr:hypothetical protein [Patescibacteria group bacterium]MBU1757846.1 hypothetical protein [Patescibacteria group bacterium]
MNKASGKDEFGANFFMQEMFAEHSIKLVRVSINKFDRKKNYFTEYYMFQ